MATQSYLAVLGKLKDAHVAGGIVPDDLTTSDLQMCTDYLRSITVPAGFELLFDDHCKLRVRGEDLEESLGRLLDCVSEPAMAASGSSEAFAINLGNSFKHAEAGSRKLADLLKGSASSSGERKFVTGSLVDDASLVRWLASNLEYKLRDAPTLEYSGASRILWWRCWNAVLKIWNSLSTGRGPRGGVLLKTGLAFPKHSTLDLSAALRDSSHRLFKLSEWLGEQRTVYAVKAQLRPYADAVSSRAGLAKEIWNKFRGLLIGAPAGAVAIYAALAATGLGTNLNWQLPATVAPVVSVIVTVLVGLPFLAKHVRKIKTGIQSHVSGLLEPKLHIANPRPGGFLRRMFAEELSFAASRKVAIQTPPYLGAMDMNVPTAGTMRPGPASLRGDERNARFDEGLSFARRIRTLAQQHTFWWPLLLSLPFAFVVSKGNNLLDGKDEFAGNQVYLLAQMPGREICVVASGVKLVGTDTAYHLAETGNTKKVAFEVPKTSVMKVVFADDAVKLKELAGSVEDCRTTNDTYKSQVAYSPTTNVTPTVPVHVTPMVPVTVTPTVPVYVTPTVPITVMPAVPVTVAPSVPVSINTIEIGGQASLPAQGLQVPNVTNITENVINIAAVSPAVHNFQLIVAGVPSIVGTADERWKGKAAAHFVLPFFTKDVKSADANNPLDEMQEAFDFALRGQDLPEGVNLDKYVNEIRGAWALCIDNSKKDVMLQVSIMGFASDGWNAKIDGQGNPIGEAKIKQLNHALAEGRRAKVAELLGFAKDKLEIDFGNTGAKLQLSYSSADVAPFTSDFPTAFKNFEKMKESRDKWLLSPAPSNDGQNGFAEALFRSVVVSLIVDGDKPCPDLTPPLATEASLPQ